MFSKRMKTMAYSKCINSFENKSPLFFVTLNKYWIKTRVYCDHLIIKVNAWKYGFIWQKNKLTQFEKWKNWFNEISKKLNITVISNILNPNKIAKSLLWFKLTL